MGFPLSMSPRRDRMLSGCSIQSEPCCHDLDRDFLLLDRAQYVRSHLKYGNLSSYLGNTLPGTERPVAHLRRVHDDCTTVRI